MADPNYYRSFIALTGGGTGALDKYDGTALQDGDLAVGIYDGRLHAYKLNATSGAAESSSGVISPDTNAGDKRWILQGIYALSLVVSSSVTLPKVVNIKDTSADHEYQLAVSELTANRTITLPLLTGDDEFVFAAHTKTLTNKRITSRITTITSHATPTINTDSCDCVTITAQAEAITSMTTNLSGTPTNFQRLIIRIKDNGGARAIAWGASFEAKGVALPTTTVISKVLTVGFIYDTVTSKWGCVASAQEA